MDILNIIISIFSIIVSVLAIILTIKYKQLSDLMNEETKKINTDILNNLSYVSNISIQEIRKQLITDHQKEVDSVENEHLKIILNVIMGIKEDILKNISDANWSKITQLYDYFAIIIKNNQGIKYEIKTAFDLIIVDLTVINKGFVVYNYSAFNTFNDFINRVYFDNMKANFERLSYGMKYFFFNMTTNEEIKKALKRNDSRKISDLNLCSGDLIILKLKNELIF